MDNKTPCIKCGYYRPFVNITLKDANKEITLCPNCIAISILENNLTFENKKIVEKFRAALGIEPTDKPHQVRRAIKAHKDLVFAIIEETIDEMLITGWMNNPFFMQFVDVRNLALGDENDFYVEDDSILSVSKVSGNHHNMIRQRLGANRHFSVAGEWYGLKFRSLAA